MRIIAVLFLMAMVATAEARFPRGVGTVGGTCNLTDTNGSVLTDINGSNLVTTC